MGKQRDGQIRDVGTKSKKKRPTQDEEEKQVERGGYGKEGDG
jgi:hypothetical protein